MLTLPLTADIICMKLPSVAVVPFFQRECIATVSKAADNERAYNMRKYKIEWLREATGAMKISGTD